MKEITTWVLLSSKKIIEHNLIPQEYVATEK